MGKIEDFRESVQSIEGQHCFHIVKNFLDETLAQKHLEFLSPDYYHWGMSNQPFDIRSEFFREIFDKALPYTQYVQTGTPNQIERWQTYEKAIQITDTQRLLVESFKRRMNVLVLSGVWCGDCIRQCPMLHRIARCSSEINLRFIDNQEHPLLRDELRVAGGARVPIALALSEDFFEVSRFGDRTLSHYRAKAMRELGAACDSGLLLSDTVELQSEVAEWVEFFERAQLILRLSPFLRARYQDLEMMTNRLLPLFLLSLTIILFALWRNERAAREEIEERLQQLSDAPPKSIKSYGLDVKGVAMPRPSPLATASTNQFSPEPTMPSALPVETPTLAAMAIYGIESRLSSIEKIITLTPQQRERLKDKYIAEASARRQGTKADTESLEDIIGEANARFYKQQLENAYKKAHDQELERELYYMSRRLNFNQTQENSVRDVLAQVENAVSERFKSEHASPQYTNEPTYRVRLMMQENQFRSEWLAEKLKGILNPDQFQAYVQEEAESSGAELTMWHAP